MNVTTVIGLEVHVQLKTHSKVFCGCSTEFRPDEPNTQTCPVCLGLPGALPVMNATAFELSVRTGLALQCDISRFTKWDRKQYFYPDLPKGYQISQYDLPLSHDGYLTVPPATPDDEPTRIGIIRAHLEEDAGKNLHDESGRGRESLVDLNRTGTPLLEIVSAPDIRSAAEARRYLEELRLLLTYIDVSDCNMQEGSLRCDANVNLHIDRDDGHTPVATPIVEVKNLNSFRAVEAAIDYEIRRQRKQFEETGLTIDDAPKSTAGWNPDLGKTIIQREKEEASDYRYFPDPDLVPVIVSDERIDAIRETLPEFPADRRERIAEAYELSAYDAGVIVDQGRNFVDYFEEVALAAEDGKQAANWVTQDVLRELKERELSLSSFPISSDVLGNLLRRVIDRRLTTNSARQVFAALLDESPTHPPTKERIDAIVQDRELEIVSDTGAIDTAIESVVTAPQNAKAVEDFRGGKQAAVGPLIGQVMKQVKGADPKSVREMLARRIRG